MNITYCNEICPIGKAAKEYFLNANNSAYDAVFDMHRFVENCFNACPFKGAHKEEEKTSEKS